MFQVHRLSSAMARIQRLVARGLWLHTGGVIPLEKIVRVLGKLDVAYQLRESISDERRRQRRGEACTRVVLWPEPAGLGFVLCAAPGSGEVHKHEVLKDAREPNGRVSIRDYELVRLPRPGDTARWTWRLQIEKHQMLMEMGCRLARREHAGAAQKFLDGMMQRPGFNGVRTQKKLLIRSMQREAQRAGRRSLRVPETLPWVRANYVNAEDLETWLSQERVRRGFLHNKAEAAEGVSNENDVYQEEP